MNYTAGVFSLGYPVIVNDFPFTTRRSFVFKYPWYLAIWKRKKKYVLVGEHVSSRKMYIYEGKIMMPSKLHKKLLKTGVLK